jgi:hypothetical protein
MCGKRNHSRSPQVSAREDSTLLAKDNQFENARALVEATIRSLGLSPEACRAGSSFGPHPSDQRTGNDDRAVWTLKRGSASVLVTVASHGNDNAAYLRIVSPVVAVPADPAAHASFFRRLLELNTAGLANAAFGLLEDRVVAVSERPAMGLDAVEVEQMIKHLAAVADTFDDKLEKEFGVSKV